MKTIRMPKELLDRWLAALRSGEYRQCRGQLERGGGYCCLGVLQVVTDGDVERLEDGSAHFYPGNDWLAEKGITFFDADREKRWIPYLPALDEMASTANDEGKTFPEIADAIEACAEGV